MKFRNESIEAVNTRLWVGQGLTHEVKCEPGEEVEIPDEIATGVEAEAPQLKPVVEKIPKAPKVPTGVEAEAPQGSEGDEEPKSEATASTAPEKPSTAPKGGNGKPKKGEGK